MLAVNTLGVLYIVENGKFSTKGTKLMDPDGKANAVPKTYEEQTWQVPEEGLTDTPNEDGTYNVLIYNTNGCHMYFIKVDEGDNMGEARKVAWLHASSCSCLHHYYDDGWQQHHPA